jgi:hypothetical protein
MPHTNNKTQWLDKALDGQSAHIKARVLEIILKYGIDPENEFFIIFVALGQLQVLIENSPTEWEGVFQSFHNELDQWTDSNLKILESLVSKAEATDMLAQSLKELVNLLSNLTTTCGTLLERSQTSDQTSADLMPRLEHLIKDLESSLSHSKQDIRRQNEAILQEMGEIRKKWANASTHLNLLKWLVAIALGSSLLGNVLLIVFRKA